MNNRTVSILISLMLFFGGFSIFYFIQPSLEPKEKLGLILQLDPWSSNLPKNERLTDLKEITLALEKYKRKHHRYPISNESGNMYLSATGEINKDWINGLTPTFIDKLPSAPNKYQYRYISNGVLYRVGTIEADDCEEIKKLKPLLIDKYSSTCSYGFWTVPHWEK